MGVPGFLVLSLLPALLSLCPLSSFLSWILSWAGYEFTNSCKRAGSRESPTLQDYL